MPQQVPIGGDQVVSADSFSHHMISPMPARFADPIFAQLQTSAGFVRTNSLDIVTPPRPHRSHHDIRLRRSYSDHFNLQHPLNVPPQQSPRLYFAPIGVATSLTTPHRSSRLAYCERASLFPSACDGDGHQTSAFCHGPRSEQQDTDSTTPEEKFSSSKNHNNRINLLINRLSNTPQQALRASSSSSLTHNSKHSTTSLIHAHHAAIDSLSDARSHISNSSAGRRSQHVPGPLFAKFRDHIRQMRNHEAAIKHCLENRYLFEAESAMIYAEMADLSIKAGHFDNARRYFRQSINKDKDSSNVSSRTPNYICSCALILVLFIRSRWLGLNLRKKWDFPAARSK